MEKCGREECGHQQRVHVEDGCRVTGCECQGFVLVPEKLPGGMRRITVDLPDGYALSINLYPMEPEEKDGA